MNASVCGSVAESVFYNGESTEITESTTPLFYATGTRTVNLESDNASLIDTSATYKIKAELAQYTG